MTIHHHQSPAPRLKETCPFCGQPYSNANITDCEPHSAQVRVGAGRVRSQRSGSDPVVPSFRLPLIVSTFFKYLPPNFIPENNFYFQNNQSPEHHTRYERFGHFMVRQLGGLNIGNFGNLILRPGSESSLPPISQVNNLLMHNVFPVERKKTFPIT